MKRFISLLAVLGILAICVIQVFGIDNRPGFRNGNISSYIADIDTIWAAQIYQDSTAVGSGDMMKADFADSVANHISLTVQAYDADLTTYAGITPSADMQSFLATANDAAGRTALGVAIGSDVQAYGANVDTDNTDDMLKAAFDDSLTSHTGVSVQAYDSDLTTYAGIAPSANIQTFLGSADYATARTNLGVAIGSNVQAYSANMDTDGTDDMLKADYKDSLSVYISAFGYTLVDDANNTAARTTLGLGSLATLSAVDSTLIPTGALSVTDISNGANGFALKTVALTSVTGTSPVVSSGGLTPAISMPAATASVNGYATSAQITKLDGIAAGAQPGDMLKASANDSVDAYIARNLNNVENTTLSSWVGTTNVTTLGTIGTGTWNAGFTDAALTAIDAGTWTGANSITTLGTVATGTWNATAIADGKIASSATWNAANASRTNIADTLTAIEPQMIDLPGTALIDTTAAPGDSISVMTLADFGVNSEYSRYIHLFSNGSVSAKRGVMVSNFVPIHCDVDSLTMWIRSSKALSDTAMVSVRLMRYTSANDSVVVCDSTFVASAANTWERKSAPITTGLQKGLVYEARAYTTLRRSYTMDLSPIWLKD